MDNSADFETALADAGHDVELATFDAGHTAPLGLGFATIEEVLGI